MATSSTPSSASTVRHRVSGPAELVDAIPYLLGFHPAQSLVLVGLRERRLVVTARLDLDDAYAGPTLVRTIESMRRGGSRELLAVVFADDAMRAERTGPLAAAQGELPHAQLVGRIVDAADELYCDLVDAVLVARRRMWSYLCSEPTCCPPDGTALPSAPSAFATAAAYEGVVALPDRASLRTVLAPVADRSALDPLIAQAERAGVAAELAGAGKRHTSSVKRAIFAAARGSASAGWEPPGDADLARFAAALVELPVRDAVWLAVDDRRLDGRQLWRHLARHAPTPYDAAPLFLFGWAAWRAGDGAMAGVAGELALEADPGYSAADLLQAALTQAVDPRTFPSLGASMRRADATSAAKSDAKADAKSAVNSAASTGTAADIATGGGSGVRGRRRRARPA